MGVLNLRYLKHSCNYHAIKVFFVGGFFAVFLGTVLIAMEWIVNSLQIHMMKC